MRLPDVVVTMDEVELARVIQTPSDREARRRYNELVCARMVAAGWPVHLSLFSGEVRLTGPGGFEMWAELTCNRYRWLPAKGDDCSPAGDNLSPPRNTQPAARPGILQRIRAAGRTLGA